MVQDLEYRFGHFIGPRAIHEDYPSRSALEDQLD